MDCDDFGIFIDTAGDYGGTEVKKVEAETKKVSPARQALLNYILGKHTIEYLTRIEPDPEYELFMDKLNSINLNEATHTRITPKSDYSNNLHRTFSRDKKEVQKILDKSEVLKPGFEKLKEVPNYNVSERQLKKQRKIEKEKTKGAKWFNMPATEVTDEVKRDLEVLQMRSVLDPKHFYKKNDLKVLPKYFQIGKVVDSPLDFHDRLTNKQRKRTLVDELMADAEFNKYNKKKFNEIVAEKQKTHYKAFKAAKKLKKKKK